MAARFRPFMTIERYAAGSLFPGAPARAREGGLHLREEEDLLDGFFAGEEHHQAIDADANAAGGGIP